MQIPDVILQDCSIESSQLINWWDPNKQAIYLGIETNSQVSLYIRPRKALIHRAIIMIGDEIDKILTECQKLTFHNHFSKWFLQPFISRDIKPEIDTYEYIDGAFRPNTKKILELISGLELYGNPLVAVRELLQNAFDAVREEIAYKRLKVKDPDKDPNLPNRLADSHSVRLKVELDAHEEAWLVCTDNGIGMTKAIIQNYLLVSGSARRHQIIDLERQCKVKGFSLERTGQFGIGVLSYFMLTDRIIIKTKRSLEPGDGDIEPGWQFETEGIGTFGELRKCQLTHDVQGTEIRLHLKPEIYSQGLAPQWFLQLRDYLKKILIHLPCKFTLESNNLLPAQKLELQPGWVSQHKEIQEEYTQQVIESIKSVFCFSECSIGQTNQDNKDEKEQEKNAALKAKKNSILTRIECEVREKLSWKVWDETITNQEEEEELGICRIHLPYFKLCDFDDLNGFSLAFMLIQNDEDKLVLFTYMDVNHGLKYFISLPRYRLLMSWKGILIENKMPFDICAFFEIIWHSSQVGRISVKRNQMIFNEQVVKSLLNLKEKFQNKLINFLRQYEQQSSYTLLNNFITGVKSTSTIKNRWPFECEENQKYIWRELTFPFIICPPDLNYRQIFYQQNPIPRAEHKIRVLQSVLYNNTDDLNPVLKHVFNNELTRSWNIDNYPPNCFVPIYYQQRFHEEQKLELTGMWTQPPYSEVSQHPIGHTAVFPETWNTLLCGNEYHWKKYNFDGARGVLPSRVTYIWNIKHPLVNIIDEKAWKWSKKSFQHDLNPILFQKEILEKRTFAAAWILLFLQHKYESLSEEKSLVKKLQFWEKLCTDRHEFMENLWKILFQENRMTRKQNMNCICLSRTYSFDSNYDSIKMKRLLVFNYNSVDTYINLNEYLPVPNNDNCIIFS
ncbi:MAG: ATP-binding protein [Prochloraceae cyanobacterium]|nr:ATP-binding protein [Prochloraceae cyanobacterium]